jgi:hypothetical protein
MRHSHSFEDDTSDQVLLNVPRVEDQADYLSHGAATSGRAVSMATVSGQATCVKPGGVGLSFHIESGPGAGVEKPRSPRFYTRKA